MLPHIDQARWFAEEVHVHEASLRSCVGGVFPAVRDVDNVVQESYLRVWRARLAQPVVWSKAFLFTVAWHLMSDLARRARRSLFQPPNPAIDNIPGIMQKPEILAGIQFRFAAWKSEMKATDPRGPFKNHQLHPMRGLTTLP
ncbi:MAG: hypothetical protein ACREIA_16675, partial [Opitutaceae bacterium]